MSKSRCKWCDKSIIRGKFCGTYNHKGLYKKFREEFSAEMMSIRLKKKVIDTPEYHKIRNILTSTKIQVVIE